MIKVVALLRKKDGMSRDDFVSYYEDRHAPLAQKLAGMGHDYRLNYVYTMRGDAKEAVENSD
ncbi:MAG: EthD family reductase, partial [Caulobacteraceae bacterium]